MFELQSRHGFRILPMANMGGRWTILIFILTISSLWFAAVPVPQWLINIKVWKVPFRSIVWRWPKIVIIDVVAEKPIAMEAISWCTGPRLVISKRIGCSMCSHQVGYWHAAPKSRLLTKGVLFQSNARMIHKNRVVLLVPPPNRLARLGIGRFNTGAIAIYGSNHSQYGSLTQDSTKSSKGKGKIRHVNWQMN